jgi:lysozyme family protein
MGITLATLQQWDRDPALGPVAVQDMTEQTAAAIYAALYWNVLRGHALPAGIDLSAFDFGVNAGTRCSAKLLQQALGFPRGQVDGYVGPVTLAAAAKANAAQVIGDLGELQANYYRGLDDFADFGTGWLPGPTGAGKLRSRCSLRAQRPARCRFDPAKIADIVHSVSPSLAARAPSAIARALWVYIAGLILASARDPLATGTQCNPRTPTETIEPTCSQSRSSWLPSRVQRA